jgi:hypothetical protein
VAFDPDGAKKLLAEAGYPNGFEVTLGTPNDRYINDEKVAQAAAQMLTRIGIKTNIDAMTASTFFSRRNKYEFSLYLAGWGADSGEMLNPLVALVATMDSKTGMGHTNRGRYSNPELDTLIKQAQRTVDDAKREELLRRASKLAMSDVPLIPLHFEITPWALPEGADLQGAGGPVHAGDGGESDVVWWFAHLPPPLRGGTASRRQAGEGRAVRAGRGACSQPAVQASGVSASPRHAPLPLPASRAVTSPAEGGGRIAPMLVYLIRRLGQSLLVVAVMATVVFLAVYAVGRSRRHPREPDATSRARGDRPAPRPRPPLSRAVRVFV